MRTPEEIYADIEQTELRPVAKRIIKDAQTEAYNEGRYQLDYLAQRNYAATVRRGLITPETRKTEFVDKINEELGELDDSVDYELETDWSELADIVLVCFAMAQHYRIDLIDEMRKKVEYNEQRQD